MRAEKWFERQLKKEKLYLIKVEWEGISVAFANDKNFLKLKMNAQALHYFEARYQMWLSATLSPDGVLGIAHYTSVNTNEGRRAIWQIWLARINKIRAKLLEEMQKAGYKLNYLPEGAI